MFLVSERCGVGWGPSIATKWPFLPGHVGTRFLLVILGLGPDAGIDFIPQSRFKPGRSVRRKPHAFSDVPGKWGRATQSAFQDMDPEMGSPRRFCR